LKLQPSLSNSNVRMGFFSDQRYDDAGVLAVKLQKFIIFLFILSMIWFGLNVQYMVETGQFFAGPYLLANLCWLVLYAGFLGAYRRNTVLLFLFFVFCLFGIFVVVAGFVATSITVTLEVLEKCKQTPGCDSGAESIRSVLIVTGVTFCFTIGPLLLLVIGAVLALMTRSEIFIAREEASIKQSLMEEGIAIPVHEKASRAEEPKQVAPDAALEPFGQMGSVPQFVPAGWEAPDVQPVGAYPHPMVYYYYYPPQQQ